MNGRLNAKIAEVAQLKSIQHVKLKKLNEQRIELEQRLAEQQKQTKIQDLTERIETKERCVRKMETQ